MLPNHYYYQIIHKVFPFQDNKALNPTEKRFELPTNLKTIEKGAINERCF